MSSESENIIPSPFPPFRRIITTHTESDTDGSSVELLDKTFRPTPLLGGRAHCAPIFSSLGLPATSEHHITEADVDEAKERVKGVVLQDGINGQITDLPPNQGVGYHRTNSIDYNILLCGSVWLITPSTDPKYAQGGNTNGNDEKAKPGEVWTLVKAPGMVVQRGTMHAWQATDEGARWVTVVVSAAAVEVGGKALEERDFD